MSGTRAPSRRGLLALPLVVVSGAGLALQARLNAELAARMDAAVAGPALSLAGGTLTLLVLAAALPRMRAGLGQVAAALRAGRLRRWHLLGGLGGAALVTSQGLTVGAIGVAAFTVGVVAGQTTSSLIVDRAGIGPGGRRPVTGTRLAGAGLTFAAVVLAVSGNLGAPADLALAVIPLLAGVVVAWQQAVNAQVNAAAGSGITGAALPATLVNFVVGTLALALAVAVAVETLLTGPPLTPPADPLLYLGGPLGVVFIVAAAAVVGRTGVLLFGLAAIGGQLLGALLLDLLSPTAGGRPGLGTVAGTVLALIAVAVAALPGRAVPERTG